ncbi:endoglucanase, putative [Paecilomyces variotii No. 5]|uniref:Endoglucanase, putative n=1 Tax=Byssochlamys spectabilis (strain No. 5 / NBRC 109023) TaxID=1356009 RepID=V5FD10_BYSSN|nr:endoglucanase, putative [Paecilomyces variotii No. 5]
MPFSKIAILATILGTASLVSGHGYVQGIVADGKYYGGYIVTQYPYTNDPPELVAWSTEATDLGFVDGSGYASGDIICHKSAQPAALAAEVPAGGKVELQWTEWPESHHGPVLDYLAPCNGNCADVDKTALEFFKIDQGGLVDDSSPPGTWASDQLISNNNSWTVTIPSTIAPGNYVLRHEIIALHSAGNKDGAQNYPQCINIKVTGSGTDSPSGTLGTSLYKDTDPGILVNIYQTLSDYSIPGPALYEGGSSSGTSSGSGTSTATSTSVASSTSVKPSSISTPSSVQVAIPSAKTSAVPATTQAPTTATPAVTIPTESALTDYLNSMSADEVLNLVRGTMSWLFTNKNHARDLSASSELTDRPM